MNGRSRFSVPEMIECGNEAIDPGRDRAQKKVAEMFAPVPIIHTTSLPK